MGNIDYIRKKRNITIALRIRQQTVVSSLWPQQKHKNTQIMDGQRNVREDFGRILQRENPNLLVGFLRLWTQM